MPKIFRTMLADGTKPKVGSESNELGVRTPPNPHPDILVDEERNVHPETGGMSVAPAWRDLPWHLIPRRLHPRARGKNALVCWRLGDGEFASSVVTGDLKFRTDPSDPRKHGFVEPSRVMTIEEYREALAGTRDDWIQDEN